MREYYDLNAGAVDEAKKSLLERLGWNAAGATGGDFSGSALRLVRTAIVSENPRKNARKALEKSEIIIASGDSDEFYREASECVEVDLIQDPELMSKNDAVDYPSSGLDGIIAKSMSLNNIGYAINYRNVLESRGMKRAQILWRIRYNVMLCTKYGVNIVTASCATDKMQLRAPLELASIGCLLGLDRSGWVKTVSDNPANVLCKAADRDNPDVITKGLKVVEWGGYERKASGKCGWY
ncbi:MAG: RNase P subunit p30 family protein [Candidatus Altiarchaeota archaeon]